MALARRIILFLVVNFLVVIVLSFVLSLFNIQPFLEKKGLNLYALAVFCLIWGMGGAFISLAMSRIMAKWMMGVELIDPQTRDSQMRTLLEIVYNLSKKAGLPRMPEVGVYRSPEVNAFATGPTRNRALVATSTGLLERMDKDEIEAVLGHEISHVANGDMVTMTLLQGVINAFVMFLARILAFVVSRALSRNKESDSAEVSPFVFQIFVFIFEICFMILGSIVVAYFCRYREFRADAGGARLAGRDKMIAALQALQRCVGVHDEAKEQAAFQALKISSQKGFMHLFASHPPLEERIARLKKLSFR